MKIAYLASTVTLPDSPNRRDDAFEHDQMIEALEKPFAERGMQLCPIAWDDPEANWSDFAAAIIGTTWDYWDRQAEFLETLERIASQTPLFNSAKLVRWNSHKSYLRQLETRGAKLIPTVWLDQPTTDSARDAFSQLDSKDVIFKRQVGAGAHGQFRLKPGDPIPEMPEPMMAQPFLPAILSEGEFSFIFIDRQLSHTLIKRPKTGDYRIQSLYGGIEECIKPSALDQNAAEAILATLDESPLYARVDMVRAETGNLLLMELEAIEPFLYPLQGPNLGKLIAEAVKRRVANAL